MPVDFAFSFVIGGVPFAFVDPYDISDWDDGELDIDIPAARPSGGDGEYAEDGNVPSRTVVLSGVLTADTAAALRPLRDTLAAALVKGQEGKLYRHGDRFLYARVRGLVLGKDFGLNDCPWSARFKASDPFYYEDSLQTLALSTGSNPITGGGGYPALPVFTFVVSAAGTLTVTHAATGQSFILTAATTGTYIVDATAGTVVKSPSTDAIASFSGEFFDQGLAVAASTVTLTAGGGLTLSDASASWRRRYANG